MNYRRNKHLDNKGQALVEFALILPVFLFMLFAVYDFGMIFIKKNSLENSSGDIINLYRDGKSIDDIKKMYSSLNIKISEGEEYDKILVEDKVKLVTPGFNRIFGNPYVINVERYIANE